MTAMDFERVQLEERRRQGFIGKSFQTRPNGFSSSQGRREGWTDNDGTQPSAWAVRGSSKPPSSPTTGQLRSSFNARNHAHPNTNLGLQHSSSAKSGSARAAARVSSASTNGTPPSARQNSALASNRYVMGSSATPTPPSRPLSGSAALTLNAQRMHAQPQHSQYTIMDTSSPLTINSVPRLMRSSSSDVHRQQQGPMGLPPQSPSKGASRPARPPSGSMDGPGAKATSVSHNQAARLERALSSPSNSNTRRGSMTNANNPPTLSFGAPRVSAPTSANGSSSSLTKAAAAAVAAVDGSSASHATAGRPGSRPGTATAAVTAAMLGGSANAWAGAGDWMMEEPGQGTHASDKLGARALSCSPTPPSTTTAAALDRRNSMNAAKPTPRTAWDTTGSGASAGTGAATGVQRSVSRSGSGRMSHEGGVGSGWLGGGSGRAVTPSSPSAKRMSAAGNVPSAAGSPMYGNSGNLSGFLGATLENSGTGTLTCMNPSKYTSNFGLSYAAESQGDMEGLGPGHHRVSSVGDSWVGGSTFTPRSSGQLLMAGEGEPTSPYATTVPHSPVGFASSMRPPSPSSSGAALRGTRRCSDMQPQQHQGFLQAAAAHHSTSGPPSLASSLGATGSGGGGLLSGAAIAAHRAMKGAPPTQSPSIPLHATDANANASAAEGGETGTQQQQQPSGMHSRSNSFGDRGPSLLRRNSAEPDSAHALAVAATATTATGSGRLFSASTMLEAHQLQAATPAPAYTTTDRANTPVRRGSFSKSQPNTASKPPPSPTPPSAPTAFAAPAAQTHSPGKPYSDAASLKASETASAVPPSPPVVAPTGLPPLGLPPSNYGALLGCEVNEEHTAALPGYTVGKVIGEGGFCQVRLAVQHLSRSKVAVKVIDKSKLTDANESKRIQREIRVMLHLTHECIIKLFEVVDSTAMLYLVMEYAPNQSLLDYVRSRKWLAEGKAATILQQIVAGLRYCHRKEVVHRDVKLENILLGADGNMKLIDFGLSAFFIPGKKLRVHCGSPSYAAPEIVSRKQYDGPPVDVWSLGVVLFACLAGHLPFHSSTGNKQDLCQKIIDGHFNMPQYLSPAAKDLLTRMLTVDPEKRVTFDQVQAHPWVQSVAAWVPKGGSVYSISAGGVNEYVVAELELAGWSRQEIMVSLQNRSPTYLTTSYYLMAEHKRANEQQQQQQQQQQQAWGAEK